MFYLCSATNSAGVVEYLFFDPDAKAVFAKDYNSAVELITSHKVENAKLENAVIKAADRVNKIRLTAENRGKSVAFYIFSEDDELIYAVDNRGEIFIMSMNVAAEFFKGKTLLNATLHKDGVEVCGAKRFTNALNRDYRHAVTK